VQRGQCRQHVNHGAQRVKRIFRWAVAEELIPPISFQALNAMEGLKRGHTDAREGKKVKPVPLAYVDAIEPFTSRPVWAMIQLQLLTGARPGEIVLLRPVDLDTSGPVWLYRPPKHKSLHLDKDRVVFLGPKAQAILQPFLSGAERLDGYIFSPADAITERHATAKTHRRPNQAPNTRRTRRRLGDHYTVASYRRAIWYACEQAWPPPAELARQQVAGKRGLRMETAAEWRARLGTEGRKKLATWYREHRWHPHQLRHAHATAVRRQFGLDGAQITLGHAHAAVSQIYAEADKQKGIEIARQIG
jgi:integrase